MSNIEQLCKEKIVYSFGDSIIAGHTFPLGFVDYACKEKKMNHQKYAINGATVIDLRPDRSYILDQIRQAPSVQPDFVVFDGGTNDAFEMMKYSNKQVLKNDVEKNRSLESQFENSFETLLVFMKEKWPNTQIIYVVPHSIAGLNIDIQEKMIDFALASCAKHKISVVDIYHDSCLNTHENNQRVKYSFDTLGDDGLPGNNGSGTHPNLQAIDEFYLPLLRKALRELNTD